MSATATAFSNPTAVIGKTVVIKGDIQSKEPLVIEGQVEGTVEISDHLLTIAAGANVRAQIVGSNVEVRGRLQGQIEAAQTVFIRKDAEFIGDLFAKSLVIEDGSYIKGNIELARADSQPQRGAAAAKPPLAESKSIRELSHAVSS